MSDAFLKHILSVKNTTPQASLSWDVLNHETNTVTSFPVKLDALLYQQTLPHATVYFNWYDDMFAKFAYYTEPAETLAELQRKRAQDIRNRYDYVRFWFSGGSDSTTALNAFMDNNIHIDEIVLYTFPDKNVADPLLSCNRELFLSAKPYLELNAHRLVNTKITDVSLDYNEYKRLLSGPDSLGYVPYLYSMDNGSFLYGLNSSQYVWEKMIKQTEVENYCDVYGGTKVMVYNSAGEYYMYMIDTGIPDMALSERGEDFFLSRTDPSLFVKTAHLLKRYAKLNNLTPKQVVELQKKTANAPKYNFAIGRDPVHNDVAMYKLDRDDGNYSQHVGRNIRGYKQFLLVENLGKDESWAKLFKAHGENLNIMRKDYSWIWNLNDKGEPDPGAGYKGHLSKFYSLERPRIADNTEVIRDGIF